MRSLEAGSLISMDALNAMVATSGPHDMPDLKDITHVKCSVRKCALKVVRNPCRSGTECFLHNKYLLLIDCWSFELT